MPSKSRGAVLFTLVEKTTRFSITILIPSKTQEGVDFAMRELLDIYGSKFSEVFKSITADNGAEFTRLSKYEKYGVYIYCTHPYIPWERGQNERINRDIRQYYPKRKSVDGVTNEDVQQDIMELNSKPKKVLDYKSADELFEAKLDEIYLI